MEFKSENKTNEEKEPKIKNNEIYVNSNSFDSRYKDLKIFTTHGFSPLH
jgi:hypothetical protein